MHGYTIRLLVFSTMVCFTTSYREDLYQQGPSYTTPLYPPSRKLLPPDPPVQRGLAYGYAQNNGRNTPLAWSNNFRHTQTAVGVNAPAPLNRQDTHNNPFTTVRSYWNAESFNRSKNSNVSDSPELTSKTSTKRKSSDYEDTKMVYPSDHEARTVKPPRQIVSRNCSFGLCDEADNYPSTEKIISIINRSPALKQYFALITISINNKDQFEDGETLCSTTMHTRFPKTAMNTNNVEQFLVNVDNYKQGIVYETCASNGGACKFSETFPGGYESSCKQKYTIRRLMVLGKENENPVFDNFELPSCCVCTLK